MATPTPVAPPPTTIMSHGLGCASMRRHMSTRVIVWNGEPGVPARPASTPILRAGFYPVEGPRHRFLPEAIKPFARCFIHPRFPSSIDCPMSDELVSIFEEADRQPRGIRSAQRRRLFHHRKNYRLRQHVRLKLHQQIVHHHSTVNAQRTERDARVPG